MQTDSPKITMSAAETSFDDKIKLNMIEGASAERIVKTAESYRGLVRLTSEVSTE